MINRTSKIIPILLNSILGLFSYFIPKKKNQFLFGSYGNFVGNPKYFFLYLCDKKTMIKPVWMARTKETYSLLDSRNLPVVYLHSLKGFFCILCSKFLIFDHLVGDLSYTNFLFGKFKQVYLWHGTPIKKISVEKKAQTFFDKILTKLVYSKTKKLIHTVLAPSDEIKEIFSNVFNTNNVKVLGYPRNDIFFDNKLAFEDYRKKLSLNKYQKVILYCPTFRDVAPTLSPFSHEFLTRLNEYLVEQNFIFLMKTHKMDNFWKKTPKFSNILDVSNDVNDIQDLLIHVDILITDYSSVFFEFILLDRPIIFYCYDLDEYLKNSREMYFDYFKELPGPFARTESELFIEIKSIDSFFHNPEYQKNFNKFKKRFNFFQDGSSCKRLLTYLTGKPV